MQRNKTCFNCSSNKCHAILGYCFYTFSIVYLLLSLMTSTHQLSVTHNPCLFLMFKDFVDEKSKDLTLKMFECI